MSAPDDKSLGKFIRRVRKARKIKGSQLARAIGKSNAYVCDLEKGRRGQNISPEMAMQIADYLQIDAAQLFAHHPNLAPVTNTSKLNQIYRAIRHKSRAKRILLSLEGLQKVVDELKDEVTAKQVTPRAESTILRGAGLLKDLQIALTVG